MEFTQDILWSLGIDPDLPGGTLEEDETPLEAMLREVQEESGLVIDANDVREIYSGTEYSVRGTHYSLFVAKIKSCPEIMISWKHLSYAWVNRSEFLTKLKRAKDTYMQMVHDVLK